MMHALILISEVYIFFDGIFPVLSEFLDVTSPLANALKRINTQRIFMALSADEVPLNVNSPENPGVVSVGNNPKYETA